VEIIETAVRKITGLPAEHFALPQRGFLRAGYFADVLVFDPGNIAPNVDFFHPVGTPSGIEHVFINGGHVLENGVMHIDKLSGRVITKN
jgi:N-acyl-D-amino-acid deacylase